MQTAHKVNRALPFMRTKVISTETLKLEQKPQLTILLRLREALRSFVGFSDRLPRFLEDRVYYFCIIVSYN